MYSPFILLILGNMDKDPQDMSMNANRNVYMIMVCIDSGHLSTTFVLNFEISRYIVDAIPSQCH